MGKILDGFMKVHELDDAQVLAMIGEAYLQIADPEFVYNTDKDKIVPDDIKEESKRMIPEAAFASLAALMERSEGGDEDV